MVSPSTCDGLNETLNDLNGLNLQSYAYRDIVCG